MSRFDLSVMTYFWLIHPNFDKFRDIPCLTVNSVLITGFRDSVWVFCMAEIIGPYLSRTGLTRYSVPPVLKKTWYRDVFIFLVPTWYRSTRSFDNTNIYLFIYLFIYLLGMHDIYQTDKLSTDMGENDVIFIAPINKWNPITRSDKVACW